MPCFEFYLALATLLLAASPVFSENTQGKLDPYEIVGVASFDKHEVLLFDGSKSRLVEAGWDETGLLTEKSSHQLDWGVPFWSNETVVSVGVNKMPLGKVVSYTPSVTKQELTTGPLHMIHVKFDHFPQNLALDAKRQWLICTWEDGGVRVYHLGTHAIISEWQFISRPTAVVAHPNSHAIFVSTACGDVVALSTHEEEIAVLYNHSKRVVDMCFLETNRIAIVDVAGSVFLVDANRPGQIAPERHFIDQAKRVLACGADLLIIDYQNRLWKTREEEGTETVADGVLDVAVQGDRIVILRGDGTLIIFDCR